MENKNKHELTTIQYYKLLKSKIHNSNLCRWLVRDAIYPLRLIYHWALSRIRCGTCLGTWDYPKSKQKMTIRQI